MRIRRGYLFWGAFFLLLGGIPLLVDVTGADLSGIRALSWWPIVLIVLGLAILLARSRFSVIAVFVGGALLGGLIGTAIASGDGNFLGAIGCTGVRTDMLRIEQSGTFVGNGALDVRHNCGTLVVRPAAGDTWTLTADYHGTAPEIDQGPSNLEVRTRDGVFQRQDWTIQLPVGTTRSVDLEVNAGTGDIDLSGHALDDLGLQGNAADIKLLAEGGSIGSLDVQINAGRGRLTLGEPVPSGNLQVNAGSIDLCVPPNAGLSLEVDEQFGFGVNMGASGLTHSGDVWTRIGTGGPQISLTIEGNAASFNLNPAGGCR